jgi:uncharacterized coiled-coil protein SlyX
MKSILARIIGIVLVIATAAGIVLSLIGIVQIWRLKAIAEESLMGNLDLLDSTLAITLEGLTTVEKTLQSTTDSLDSLGEATSVITQSLAAPRPALDSLSELVSKDLPATITSTQTSLKSAQSSALLIDNILTALTKIPLLSLDRYAPEVPLHVALGEVSDDLGAIRPSLNIIENSLDVTDKNIDTLSTQMTNLSNGIQQINENLAGAQVVIDKYQDAFPKLQGKIDTAQEKLPGQITSLAWILSFALVWLVIIQLGLLLLGLQYLGIKVN